MRDAVSELFERHAQTVDDQSLLGEDGIARINDSMRRMERFWMEQIRYIY